MNLLCLSALLAVHVVVAVAEQQLEEAAVEKIIHTLGMWVATIGIK